MTVSGSGQPNRRKQSISALLLNETIRLRAPTSNGARRKVSNSERQRKISRPVRISIAHKQTGTGRSLRSIRYSKSQHQISVKRFQLIGNVAAKLSDIGRTGIIDDAIFEADRQEFPQVLSGERRRMRVVFGAADLESAVLPPHLGPNAGTGLLERDPG